MFTNDWDEKKERREEKRRGNILSMDLESMLLKSVQYLANSVKSMSVKRLRKSTGIASVSQSYRDEFSIDTISVKTIRSD